MANDLTVRAASPADLAAVDALLGRSYPALLKEAYPPSVLVTVIPLISKAQPGLLASGTYYVVENAAGEIVGAGGWTRAAPGGRGVRDPHVGHVRHVVSDHRRVRAGIGRALMRHLMAKAKADGITQLECYSTLTAVPFYEAMGFVSLNPMDVTLAGGITFPSVHMRAAL